MFRKQRQRWRHLLPLSKGGDVWWLVGEPSNGVPPGITPPFRHFRPFWNFFIFFFKVRALSDGSKFDGIATAGNSIFNVLTTTCCTFLVNFQKKVEKKTSRRVLLNLNKFLKNKNCRPLASISESTSRSREIRTQHSRPTHTKKKKRIKNQIENGRRAQIIIGPRMRIVIWKNPRRSRRPGLPHGECTMWYHVERLELADGWKRQWLHSGAPLREGLTGREQPRLRLADRPSRVGTPANQGPCYCFLRSKVKRWKAGRPQLGSVRQRSRLCWWNLRSSESSNFYVRLLFVESHQRIRFVKSKSSPVRFVQCQTKKFDIFLELKLKCLNGATVRRIWMPIRRR